MSHPTCEVCGLPAAVNRVNRTPEKTCGSAECRRERKRVIERARIIRVTGAVVEGRVCIQCAEPFPAAARIGKVYCSNKCNQRHKRSVPNTRTCRHCSAVMVGPKRRQCGSPECERLAAARQVREHRRSLTGQARMDFLFRDRDYQHRRNLAKKADRRVITPRDWRRLVDRYRGCCAYCGQKKPLTQEHVIPLVRGGRHAIVNLLPVCGSCNSSKKERLLTEWRLYIKERAVKRSCRGNRPSGESVRHLAFT